MPSVFDPPDCPSTHLRDSTYSCDQCGHAFDIPEMYPGEAKDEGEIHDCKRCGAEGSEVVRL